MGTNGFERIFPISHCASSATLARRASFEVAHFGPLSPEYFAKYSLQRLVRDAKYLGERAGVRGQKRHRVPPLPNPLPLEFAEILNSMDHHSREFLGERGQVRNFKTRERGTPRWTMIQVRSWMRLAFRLKRVVGRFGGVPRWRVGLVFPEGKRASATSKLARQASIGYPRNCA